MQNVKSLGGERQSRSSPADQNRHSRLGRQQRHLLDIRAQHDRHRRVGRRRRSRPQALLPPRASDAAGSRCERQSTRHRECGRRAMAQNVRLY